MIVGMEVELHTIGDILIQTPHSFTSAPRVKIDTIETFRLGRLPILRPLWPAVGANCQTRNSFYHCPGLSTEFSPP